MNIDEAVSKAQHRIEEMCNKYKENELYVSFSGGKDSTVVLWLCKQCYEMGTIPYLPRAVFSNTGLELQTTYDFVEQAKKWYGNIEVIKPEKSFVYCIKEYGKPMFSKTKSEFLHTYQKLIKQGERISDKETLLERNRQGDKKFTRLLLLLLLGKSHADEKRSTSKFMLGKKDLHVIHEDFNIKISDKCCYVLKKKPFEEYALEHGILAFMDGEMVDEGGIRASAYEKRVQKGGKACTVIKEIGSGKNKREIEKKMPIIDWSKDIEDEFIERYKVPLSDAYTKYGCVRTGCFLCPYAKNRKDLKERLEMLYKYEPKKYRYAMATMKDVYIAENIELPFDNEFEQERIEKWDKEYKQMRYEMQQRFRDEKKSYQQNIFEFMEETEDE